ncbi:type II toxin-antitoxin system VapC family toxin [Rhodoferax sp.]|uniref:type II toxin-antitoxin system VapC family toxin n=1 Tax=Rhodoferax sp. TaxID=50421 RepID=UPI0027698FB2|nr:type II toxin-antitoxin system VapC family toxin [Rhodoferax sp.]
MTPERLVLDTNIVIDLLKIEPAVVDRFLVLLEAQTQFLICPVVVAEVYAGAFKREHKDIEALFDLCQRVDMDIDTGRMAGVYANQYAKAFQGISLEDCILAATARTHRCPLWTHNRKHYPMDDLDLFAA